MPLAQPDYTLRLITLFSICWSIGFLAPYTSLIHEEFPIMLLIPQGLSSIYALYHLSGIATTYRYFNITVDFALAATMIGMVIAANVIIKETRYWGRVEWPMLAAYGCVASMVNAVIHVYFVLREISFNPFGSQTCPHCRYEVLCRPWSVGGGLRTSESSATSDRKDGAEPQSADEYREARPSTDDETARLV